MQVWTDLVGFPVPQSVALSATSLEQALALLEVTLAQIDCREWIQPTKSSVHNKPHKKKRGKHFVRMPHHSVGTKSQLTRHVYRRLYKECKYLMKL